MTGSGLKRVFSECFYTHSNLSRVIKAIIFDARRMERNFILPWWCLFLESLCRKLLHHCQNPQQSSLQVSGRNSPYFHLYSVRWLHNNTIQMQLLHARSYIIHLEVEPSLYRDVVGDEVGRHQFAMHTSINPAQCNNFRCYNIYYIKRKK